MLKKIYASGLLLLTIAPHLDGMYLTRPYEQMVRPEIHEPFCFQTYVLAEHGFGMRSFDDDGNNVNALRIWDKDQNALKMLEGFDPASEIGQLRIQINANDDGTRGHYAVSGDFNYGAGIGLAATMSVPCNVFFSMYLPFYHVKLSNVTWNNKTLDLTADDARVRHYLTDDFFSHIAELGKLNLQGWSRSGIGDFTVMAEWVGNFKQTKEFLQNVQLKARAALLFPTGKKSDEHLIFALPFGNDGAFGALIGGQLMLTIACYLRLGVDVELTGLVSSTRERRIKTHVDQTELLLLQKALTLRDHGLTQRFNLSAELYRIFDRLSLKVGYQFLRHGDDTFTVCDNKFSSNIATTAASLQEWTLHNLFFVMSYEGSHDECKRFHPYISAFVKIPFNGQYMAAPKTIGAVFAVDF